MKIKSIEYDNDKNLFVLNIKNKKYNISYELFEKLKITKDHDLNEEEFKKKIYKSSLEKKKDKALYYTNYTQRTKQQVKNKLNNLTNNEFWIEKIIEDFYRMGLLDDERFTEILIRDKLRKGESKRKIEDRLFQKGIKEDLRNKYLSNIDSEIEYENACKSFEKKFSNKDMKDFKIKQKAYNHLLYRGFTYETIQRVIDKYEE